MAGSMGALGGDLSLSGTNPAGISVMNSSQLSITPYLRQSTVNTTHYDNRISESQWNLRLSNLGLNISLREDDMDWKNVYLTYSFNNRQDFTRTSRYEANNPESSQLDVFFNEFLFLQGNDLEGIATEYPFDISLAWNTFLLDTFNNFFFTAIPNYGQKQSMEYRESGRIGESNFAVSGMYRDKLYLGASFALTSARYELNSTLTEEIPERDTSTFLNYYDYQYNLIMSGEAISLKAGAIYKWSDWFRTGFAVHTPEFYSFTDSWNADILAEYESGVFEDASEDGFFDYRIRTPWRFVGSVAYIYKKVFLFNVDYEYLQYAQAELRGEFNSNNPFGFENEWLANNALQGHNIRFGAEYNYKSYGFRAGFAYYSKAGNLMMNSDTRIFSLGLGNTLERFYWDLAVQYRDHGRQSFYLYNPSFAQIRASERVMNSTSTSMTVGLRF